jgi:hypothetical protein
MGDAAERAMQLEKEGRDWGDTTEHEDYCIRQIDYENAKEAYRKAFNDDERKVIDAAFPGKTKNSTNLLKWWGAGGHYVSVLRGFVPKSGLGQNYKLMACDCDVPQAEGAREYAIKYGYMTTVESSLVCNRKEVSK